MPYSCSKVLWKVLECDYSLNQTSKPSEICTLLVLNIVNVLYIRPNQQMDLGVFFRISVTGCKEEEKIDKWVLQSQSGLVQTQPRHMTFSGCGFCVNHVTRQKILMELQESHKTEKCLPCLMTLFTVKISYWTQGEVKSSVKFNRKIMRTYIFKFYHKRIQVDITEVVISFGSTCLN